MNGSESNLRSETDDDLVRTLTDVENDQSKCAIL